MFLRRKRGKGRKRKLIRGRNDEFLVLGNFSFCAF